MTTHIPDRQHPYRARPRGGVTWLVPLALGVITAFAVAALVHVLANPAANATDAQYLSDPSWSVLAPIIGVAAGVLAALACWYSVRRSRADRSSENVHPNP